MFLPFAALVGNILEFKTTISSSYIFWMMHWYEPFLLVGLVWGIWRFIKSYKSKEAFGHPFLIAGLLIIYSAIIALCSGDRGRSFEGFRLTILPVLFFVLAVLINFTKEEKNRLLKLYLTVSAVVALWAIVERFFPAKYWNDLGLIDANLIFGWGWHGAGGFVQSASFVGGPNQLGSFLLPALFLVVYGIQHTDNSKPAHKTVYCLLSTVISLAIVLTLSRSAILGMIVGLVVYLLYFNHKKFLIYSVSSMFIVGLFLIWFFAASESLKNIVTHSGQTGHATAFTETMAEIKTRATEEPAKLIFGSGLGTAGPLSIKYGDGFISESWYLQLALEIGLVGLALWLCLITVISKELLKKNEKGLFLGLLAVSVAAVFLHTWADNPALSLTLFGIMGSLIGLSPKR